MRKLTEKATEDATAIRFITVITLTYLPVSVVANFFSTAFVTRTSKDGQTTLTVADDWWILAAVAIPLTATTFILWRVLYRREAYLEKLRHWSEQSTARFKSISGRRRKADIDAEKEAAASHSDQSKVEISPIQPLARHVLSPS